MVGLSCALGVGASLPHDASTLAYTDEEVGYTYRADGMDLAGSLHALLGGDQPARADDGDVLVWVWGDVYGFGDGEAYQARDGPPDGSAAYCARLYDRHGLDFVRELNGDFALVVRDLDADTVSFVTDRLATHPLFVTRPTDDTLLVESNLQTLASHPDIAAEFNLPYLYEYFQLRRVFGVETPLADVRELPPATIVTVDLADLSVERETYWRPSYEPVDESFSTYLDRFVDTFETVVDEWVYDDLDYGVLLSGGSDSRLVMSAFDSEVTAFHIADWMSREASVAREAAEAADNEFRLLKRDDDYERRALAENGDITNFSGWFDQAYFSGFTDDIVDEVDVLVSGLYADMLFGGGPVATRTLSLGSVGTLSLPIERPVDTVPDYVDTQTAEAIEPLPYFDDDLDVDRVVAANIERDEEGVVSHGVRYESLTDLLMYGDFYPMGADTDAIFSRCLTHMRPYRTPLLDNRLLDLQQQIPFRHFLRRNLVNRAVERFDPALASIPHARTGVPLEQPFPIEYVGGNLKGFWRKHIHETTPPEAHFDHRPWPDREALLRAADFPIEAIVAQRDQLESLPFLDYEGALECYRGHLEGENNTTSLYSLLTFLRTPLAERAADSDGETPADHGSDHP